MLQLNLSRNALCGITTDERGDLQGTYNAEGITAIADALRVTAELTSLDVGYNHIYRDEAKQLAAAVLAKPTLEIFTHIPLKELRMGGLTTLDLSGKGLGIPEAIVLADLLQSVGEALTKSKHILPNST